MLGQLLEAQPLGRFKAPEQDFPERCPWWGLCSLGLQLTKSGVPISSLILTLEQCPS